jgi:hypothetical protein
MSGVTIRVHPIIFVGPENLTPLGKVELYRPARKGVTGKTAVSAALMSTLNAFFFVGHKPPKALRFSDS